MLRALTKCPPLICHSLCPSQLSAGRVKVRVLKDDPGESSPDQHHVDWMSLLLQYDARPCTGNGSVHLMAVSMQE